MEFRDVLVRLRRGEPVRHISRETGIWRPLVREFRDTARAMGWLSPESALPSEAEIEASREGDETGADTHPLDAHRDDLERWLKEGKSFVVIHALLPAGVAVSESTVRRYVHRNIGLGKLPPVVTRQTTPGEVMEVDFGYLGLVIDWKTKTRRKAWVFSGRLRHSRKAWREVVLDETQETFFRCHINAFEHFGGVPWQVVPDNLKAAVIKASYECPLINRAYQSLALHYGFSINPTLPYTPQHKGGVENDIKYIKRNFWPIFSERQKQLGHELPWLEDIQAALDEWNRSTADVRRVKGIGRSPADLFRSEEKSNLLGLPMKRWEQQSWEEYTVPRNWRLPIKKTWYSVPWRLIGEKVLVCITKDAVSVLHRGAQVAVHRRGAPGEYVENPEHRPPGAVAYASTTKENLLARAAEIGPSTRSVAESIFADKAVDGLRPARSLLALGKRYTGPALELACERALRFGAPEYLSVKNILAKGLASRPDQPPVAPAPNPEPQRFRFAREPGYFLGRVATSISGAVLWMISPFSNPS